MQLIPIPENFNALLAVRPAQFSQNQSDDNEIRYASAWGTIWLKQCPVNNICSFQYIFYRCEIHFHYIRDNAIYYFELSQGISSCTKHILRSKGWFMMKWGFCVLSLQETKRASDRTMVRAYREQFVAEYKKKIIELTGGRRKLSVYSSNLMGIFGIVGVNWMDGCLIRIRLDYRLRWGVLDIRWGFI